MKTEDWSLGAGASRRSYVISFLLLACWVSAAGAKVTLVPAGAVWRYNASGTDLGTAWREPAFPDSGWSSGPAQLGYGDGDEATVLPAKPVYACYYFRHSFDVANPATFSSLSLEVLRDDGCVVYLNGQEVVRYNMPASPITYSTWASSASEYPWDPPVSIPNLLVAGKNVIAVEVHQGNSASSDISLDLRLTATSEVFVSLNSPAALATGVPLPATLSATATSPTGENVNVAFYGRPAPAPVPDFTVVMLPDIQKYTSETLGGTHAIFLSQTAWIAANRQALNVAHVAQLGDVSENGDNDTDENEWLCASAGFNMLETAVAPDGIPFGAAVGNHDQLVPPGDTDATTLYNKYFGISRFSGRSYFRGTFDGTHANNQCQFFSASGLDFMVIYLEFGASTNAAVLNWANQLLQANPTRRGIVVSHYLLESTGAWSAQGQALYNALKGNPNLFLLLCGHIAAEARRTDVYNGNTVHTLLADYQGYASGGNGFLRILKFSPSNNQVQVFTYSPWTSQYETDANSQFTLDVPMASGEPFTLILQNTGVASGAETTATWAGLQPGGAYEWYVYATDGLAEGASELRSFSTAVNPPLITAVAATDITANSARITWTTDKPADSLVNYGTTMAYDSTASDAAMSASHAVTLTGLQPDTTYYYTVTSTDNAGNSSSQGGFSFATLAGNHAPVAQLQSVSTAEDTALGITLTGFDADEDPLTFAIVTSPAHGTIRGTAPNLTYMPALNFNGTDSFTFKVNDGQLDSPPATVSVTITPMNDPPAANSQAVNTAEDTAVPIPLTGTDVDGDPLAYAVVTGPAHGTLSGTAPNLTYTPALNYNGPDSFTFKVNDGQVDSTPATVALTITPVNDPPVANSQAVSTAEETAVPVTLTGTDVEGAAPTFAVVTGPSHGTLSGTAPNLSYMPALNYNGPDSFTFKVNDGQVDSAPATVALTINSVNDPPVANDQTVTTVQDLSLNITLSATDVDGDVIAYQVVSAAAHGTLSGTAPNLTYAPALNYKGPDSFTFKANDGLVDSALATVAITVTAVNHPPQAQPQSVSTAEDTALGITLTGSDVDGDPLTFSVVTSPAHGTLSGTAPNLTYTPAPNYNEPDSFTFKVNDGRLDSLSATVSITVAPVNDPPVAQGQTLTTTTGTPLTATLTATDPDGDALTYQVVTGPAHGSLSGTAPNLTYTSQPGYTGLDSFTFVANDGSVNSATATVELNVTASAPPPPSNLTATAFSRSQINLSWVDNSNNEQGFEVQRSTDNITFVVDGMVNPGTTAYSSTGLAANRQYYFRVRAFNSSGYSAFSNTTRVRTLKK